jgi:uncharacterized small protein (DUF1192 family)
MEKAVDEDDVRRRPQIEIGAPLDHLSVRELKDRIEALKAEIERIESAISSKEDVRSTAEAFFKRPPSS